MDSPFLNVMLGHNHWATGVLVADARRLPSDQFERRFAIGPGSIHDTLRHIISAMGRWADRLAGVSLRASFDREGAVLSCDDLAAALDHNDADLRRVADGLTSESRWRELMEFATDEGKALRFTRAAALVHVMLHGAHHRAQIVNMRRQLGLPPLSLDLDPPEWECIQSGQIA